MISTNDTMSLRSKHKKTIQKIFENPIRSDVQWSSVESLLLALGGEITQGRESRVSVALQGVRAVFHRPHPGNVMDKGALVSLRRFLENANCNPSE